VTLDAPFIADPGAHCMACSGRRIIGTRATRVKLQSLSARREPGVRR
jgi:DNA-directed RNA polymerase subunit RPC12/RpoP